MNVGFPCVCVPCMCLLPPSPPRPEDGITSLGPGVTDGWMDVGVGN